MKNMKVSLKLITGFLIVIVLAGVVGATGIVGLNSMSNAAESMYSDMAIPLSDLALASEYFQRVRVQLRNAVIYTGDVRQLETVEADLTDRLDNFETEMDVYEGSIVREDAKRVFTELMDEYNNIMKPGVVMMLENAKVGMPPLELLETMATMTASADLIAEDLRVLNEFRLEIMSEANDGTTTLFVTLLIVIVAAIIVAAGASLFLAFYISKLISKPLIPLAGFMAQASSSGDIVLKEDDTKVIGAYAQRKDEIGRTIAAAAAFIARINEVSKVLEVVAGGDLTVALVPLSEKDTLGTSLQKMTVSLNTMFGEISTAASQVSTGSSQVADGAQALAAGATQQAATVEELSSSVSEVAEKTKANAERAETAASLAGSIKSNAEEGSNQMNSMVNAVKEINDASHSISKVIRVIDDIAFQTNILALNAAVEAARAGQHGKGFAVVAEEVRSLAAKSAEAAKDTATLIESSTMKAELGMRMAEETSASLSEIVSGIDESAAIVAEISSSSEEQAIAISQISMGIDQVAQVVQQNSATAEESAAASEEMSSQSTMLQQLAAQFKTKRDDMTLALPLSGQAE